MALLRPALTLLSLLSVAAMLVLRAAPQESKTASGNGLLLVANQREHTLWMLDPATGQRIASVTVGVNGHEVVGSPDGRIAYVPVYGNSGVGKPGTDGRTIDVVDLQSHKLVRSIDLGRGVRPHCALYGNNGRLYVTASKGIHVLASDGKYLGLIPTPRRPITLAFSGPNKKMLYVPMMGAVGPNGKEWATPEGVQNTAMTIYKISMVAEGFKGRPK